MINFLIQKKKSGTIQAPANINIIPDSKSVGSDTAVNDEAPASGASKSIGPVNVSNVSPHKLSMKAAAASTAHYAAIGSFTQGTMAVSAGASARNGASRLISTA